VSEPNPTIPGFRIERSIEPPHPRCTTSDFAYLATDPTGRRVVVKLLSLHFPLHDDAAARWPSAVHPRRTRTLVPVIVAGISNDGMPFYAMELVDGEPLARKIERGERFDRAAVRATLRDLVESGSDDLHARHVMMTPHGARAWNAGVAAWRHAAHKLVEGRYTSGGQSWRHPNLTPDEAAGRPPRIAAQLALIAYSMLTGTHYWNADRDLSSASMELLMEVIRGVGAPPSTRTDVALGAEFDRWFEQCLVGACDDPAGTFPA
jgi:hypothetical protein